MTEWIPLVIPCPTCKESMFTEKGEVRECRCFAEAEEVSLPQLHLWEEPEESC